MKAELIAAATGKTIEPKHTGLIYTQMDLARALNHYNVYSKPENLKAWSLTYLHKHHPELVAEVSKAPMVSFGTFGALCRMSERGFEFTESDKVRIYDHFCGLKFNQTRQTPPPSDTESASKPLPAKPKYTRSREAFELAIDETCMTGKLVMPSLIMSESHKDIIAMCEQILREIEIEPEGYGKLKTLVQNFCKKVLEKVAKVTTAKKSSTTNIIKNPAKQVALVKHLRREDKLGLKSIDPIDTLERKKMYVYDAKYRRLIVFVAATAAGFQYSGTTLKNVDLKKSSSKTIRKPEEFFKQNKLGIADLNKAFDELKSKESPLIASRFNNDWLILKVTEKGA